MGRHSSTNHSPPSRRHRSISPPPRDKNHHSRRQVSGSPEPPPRSPSPRTKRLKRTQSDRERGRKRESESERSHGSGRGRGSDREERKEKKKGENDDFDDDNNERRNNRSLRSRHERSPEHHRNGKRSRRSQSPPQPHASAAANAKPLDEVTNSRGDEQMNDEDDSVAKMKAAEEALEEKQKQKPSFELSGKLAAETNRFRGVTLLFNEPPEARKPNIKWRLYVFKAGEVLNEPLYIHRQSCYLFGRERRVADIPTDHPSCSKQHAVIQFRQVENEEPDGTLSKQIRPYIMDLGSTNKTFVNESPIEPQRYYELRERDTIKFGNSSREYVLLHENSIG
ncbi:hypothetical protein Lal_00021489 [Lupinus albus]|uniref:Putative transcription factor interactor and regulator FHA-SMAD family n=1 Tax=Lupinus albus TaxID=3870 RepID=A0A6A4NJT5_LUPAL|nr:putative transcription factor interactor and regulator FHA-SMAD family [Lupinus albus]KAF1881510.1 hypothetical protein Lal_00021489 [Lupinus albus]